MKKQIRSSLAPTVVGCMVSSMLIVSFFLSLCFSNVKEVTSFNSILVLLILCLSIHLVRKTSSLFFDHVWRSIPLVILWLIPVANLVFSACQFIWNDISIWTNPFFDVLLVVFSLPAFCCYYFTVISLFFYRDKSIMISTLVLDIVGLCYCPLRILHSLFYVEHGLIINVPDFLETLIADSRWFSFVIYILAFVNFIICARLFSGKSVNTAQK